MTEDQIVDTLRVPAESYPCAGMATTVDRRDFLHVRDDGDPLEDLLTLQSEMFAAIRALEALRCGPPSVVQTPADWTASCPGAPGTGRGPTPLAAARRLIEYVASQWRLSPTRTVSANTANLDRLDARSDTIAEAYALAGGDIYREPT